MAKKLYEFRALVECAAVIAANSEKEARDAISGWERAWVDTGEILGVNEDNVDLMEVREPKSGDLPDEAHVIV